MIPDETIRIGVLSDTHGHLGNTRLAAQTLREQDVSVLLHCGDVGAVEIPPLLTDWPTHYVAGNVDGGDGRLSLAIQEVGHQYHGRFGSLLVGRRRIAWLHGDDTHRLRETIDSGKWDVVCYGHTHKPEYHFCGSSLVVNPGALCRARRHTVAVVDLSSLEVAIVAVDGP